MLTRNAGQSVDDQGNFGEHGPEFLQGGEMNLRFHGYERHGQNEGEVVAERKRG